MLRSLLAIVAITASLIAVPATSYADGHNPANLASLGIAISRGFDDETDYDNGVDISVELGNDTLIQSINPYGKLQTGGASYSDSLIRVDEDLVSLSVGASIPLGEIVKLRAGLTYNMIDIDLKLSNTSFNFDDDGFGLDLGFVIFPKHLPVAILGSYNEDVRVYALGIGFAF